MKNAIMRFFRDESGFATIESLVVMGGSVWMMGVILTDITTVTMNLGNKIDNRLDYNSIVADVLQDFGPESNETDGDDTASDTGDDSGSDDDVDCVGNPGNAKCVGNAGENPNGGDDWGSGSNGMSDSDATASNSSSGSSSPGNSGNAPGKNK